jgi:hypothetical protein
MTISSAKSPASGSSRAGEKLALFGIVLQVVSLLGIVIGSVWQVHAMSALNAHGADTLAAFSDVWGRFLAIAGFCAVSFLASLVLLCIALAVYRCRAAWFFWFLAIYSWPLLLLMPPVGTAAAVFFLVYSLSRRNEFISQMPVSAAS